MWKFQWRGEEVVLRDVADKTIVWVNKFKEMGDMIVKCDPVHLMIPWAPIKFVMEVVCNKSLIQDAVADQTTGVGERQREIWLHPYGY